MSWLDLEKSVAYTRSVCSQWSASLRPNHGWCSKRKTMAMNGFGSGCFRSQEQGRNELRVCLHRAIGSVSWLRLRGYMPICLPASLPPNGNGYSHQTCTTNQHLARLLSLATYRVWWLDITDLWPAYYSGNCILEKYPKGAWFGNPSSWQLGENWGICRLQPMVWFLNTP